MNRMIPTKYFPVFLVIAVCIGLAVAQSTNSEIKINAATTGTGTITLRGLFVDESIESPSAERNVLLVVNVQEPCYQCGVTTTGSWSTASYVTPTMSVPHNYWFKTIHEALSKAEKENWEVTYLAVTRSMPFEAKNVVEHVKQPDVVTTKRHYTLKVGE